MFAGGDLRNTALALGLVLLAYSCGLVPTVGKGDPATCLCFRTPNPRYIHASFSINKRRFAGSLIYGDRYFVYGQIYPL